MSDLDAGNRPVVSGEHDPQPCASAQDLHDKLVVIFGEQLDRFHSEAASNDVEQAAKALAVLAKTLESVATVSQKLGAGAAAKLTRNAPGIQHDPSRSAPGGSQELDRQLVQLVEGLVQAEEAATLSGGDQ